MEARIAKLEADVTHLVSDMSEVRSTLKDAGREITDIRIQLATLATKLEHLPGKGFIVSAVTVGLALLTAILLFQSKLQQFIGVAPHP